MRTVLAVDTSTPTVVTGIVRAEDTGDKLVVCAARILPDCRKHNEMLVPAIQECLAEAGLDPKDVDAVVAGCGPGPFTGLRVGMATAAAFGDALGIPVYGVCSLDAIAWQARQQNSAEAPLLVTTDARRKEVYWAFYDDQLHRLCGPSVTKPGELHDVLQKETGAHQTPAVGLLVAPEALVSQVLCKDWEAVPVSNINLHPKALVAVADLDVSAPAPLVPLYLRRPDAAEPKPGVKSPAIPDVELP